MSDLKECKRPVLGFECGLASGITQSFMFNSYDRALFHSIAQSRPFLDARNWKGSPFAGVSPSFLQRAFSSGLYFPLEDAFRNNVSDSYAVDGVLVGLVGGAFTTPFNSVKYAMWSSTSGTQNSPQEGPGLVKTATRLYNQGGVARLMRGVVPTLYRDMTVGVTFSVLRHQGDNGFVNNAIAAFVATTLSSPFNFARMKVYSPDVVGSPKATFEILRDVSMDTRARESTLIGQITALVRRFNVGWGALRVGLGMGVGSQIYKTCCG